MALRESYRALCDLVEKVNQDIAAIESELTKIRNGIDLDVPEKVKKIDEKLKKIKGYRDRIIKLQNLAGEHVTSRNIESITPRPLNFQRLENWLDMIDLSLRDDPYAQRVFVFCQSNLEFLDKKSREYRAELTKLQAIDVTDAKARVKELNKQLEQKKAEYTKILGSDQMTSFADELRYEQKKWVYENLPTHYEEVTEDIALIAPGSVGCPLPFPKEYWSALQSNIGNKYFDVETGLVWLPFEIVSSEEQTILIHYSSSVDTKIVNQGLQNYLFRLMDGCRTGGHKIYFMDALHYNTSILGPLKALEATKVLEELPRNPEKLTAKLGEIIATFSDYDEVIGLADSISDYNRQVEDAAKKAAEEAEKNKGKNAEKEEEKEKKPAEKLDRTTLFLIGYPTAFPSEAVEKIKRILINKERYGVTVVIVDTFTEKKELEYTEIPEYIANSAYRIVMKDTGYVVQNTVEGEAQPYHWNEEFPQTLSETYIADIKKLTEEKNQKSNSYPDLFDLTTYHYKRGVKDLHVPVAIDQKNQPYEISYTEENFAHFLMGASGSGKSTLLHNIVTGIIQNYHPDDVELWLADFKMSEFAQYMDPLPPHVKYILLDESPELVYDLIDKLTEKMQERQMFFMQNTTWKKLEKVPPEKRHMPIIFVILDEFSIMSQAVAESDDYMLKLQNLLAKGRALGIKFVFSSQTFTHGIMGLTQTAKDQIQTRIAMKNDASDISETLSLSENTRTEQVKNWMDSLPAHYMLVKYRDKDQIKVNRLHVLFFPSFEDPTVSPYLPQRELINMINRDMRAVPESEYGRDINTYVEKYPVLVDGNSYKAYDPKYIAEKRAEYLASGGFHYDGDIYLSLGVPRRMSQAMFACLSEESRENMLLIARAKELDCTMSILLSVGKQFEAQGGSVHVWTYERNRLYRTYQNGYFSTVDVYEGLGEITYAIHELKTQISNRVPGKDLYILLGMEQICSDFENLDFADGSHDSEFGKGGEDLAADLSGVGIETAEQQAEYEAMVAVYDDRFQEELEAKFDEWQKRGYSLDKIMKLQGEMCAEHRMKMEALKDAAKSEHVLTEDKASEEEVMSVAVSSDNEAPFEEENNTIIVETVNPDEKDRVKTDDSGEGVMIYTEGERTQAELDADENAEAAEDEVEEEHSLIDDLDSTSLADAGSLGNFFDDDYFDFADDQDEDISEETSENVESVAENDSEEATDGIVGGNAEVVDEHPVKTPVRIEMIDETVEESGNGMPTMSYNAGEDLYYVLTQGSRLGYHFLLCLSSINDLQQIGVQMNQFNHKLAFQISRDDSADLFGSSILASRLPAHICQYANATERFSFRPFLHEGLSWDGWALDQNGKVLNPGDI